MEKEKLSRISETSAQVINFWINVWRHNACVNGEWLMKGYKSGRVRGLHQIPKQFGKPAVVTGSGPSLDSFDFELLKEHRSEFGIGASLSNAMVWLAHGIEPDFVISIDSAAFVSSEYLYKEIVPFFKNTTLLAPPTIHPDTFRRWPGPIAVFMPMQPGVEFVMDTLPNMYTSMDEHADVRSRTIVQLFPTRLANAGCSVNSIMECLSYLGFESLFLVGVDFGFPGGVPGCTRYRRTRTEWIPQSQKVGSYISPEPPRISNNGIFTTEEQLHYKLNLLSVWGMIRCKLYNCSSTSILGDVVPVVSPSKAILSHEELWKNYPLDTETLVAYTQKLILEMGYEPPKEAPQSPVVGPKTPEVTLPPSSSLLSSPQISSVPRSVFKQEEIHATGVSQKKQDLPPVSSLGSIRVVSDFNDLPPEIQAQIKAQTQGGPK